MIQEILQLIEEQIGVKLKLDPYFTGEKIDALGNIYFNVELNEPTWISNDYVKLERFAKKYKAIKIARNGWRRVAIFPSF